MKCLVCGGEMKTAKENVPYRSLPGVTLVGVEVSRCSECGEYEMEIIGIEALNRALAEVVIQKIGRLTPDEFRFLRKYLGWSSRDFARKFGVAPETVSRWESGKQRMGSMAERLLRLMVAHLAPVDDYSVEILGQITEEDPRPQRRSVRLREGRWMSEAVAA